MLQVKFDSENTDVVSDLGITLRFKASRIFEYTDDGSTFFYLLKMSNQVVFHPFIYFTVEVYISA